MKDLLDIEFTELFERISNLEKNIAPDIMLKLYAFNKQATFGNNFSFNSEPNVRNAFKFNAWMQLKDMSAKKAKKEYIKLAKKIINPKQ